MLARIVFVLSQFLIIALFFVLFYSDGSLSRQRLVFEHLNELTLEESPSNEKQPKGTIWSSVFQGKREDEKHFRVALPHSTTLSGQSIVVSGFRHFAEIKIDNKTIFTAGKKKYRWAHANNPIFVAPLNDYFIASEANKPVVLEIKITSTGAARAMLGQLWIGPHQHIQAAADSLNWGKIYLPFVTLGILIGLTLFLAMDSAMSVESKKYFILTLPHLVFAIACLPEPESVNSVLWLKMFQIGSTTSILFWSYFGVRELGLQCKYLDWLIGLSALMIVPYFILDDAIDLHSWGAVFHSKVVFSTAIAHYLYMGWMRAESNSRLKHMSFILIGAILMGIGAADVIAINSPDIVQRDLLLPVASFIMTMVILANTIVNARLRGKKLVEYQQVILDQVKQRTRELDNTQSKLLQHQRFKTMNAMGAAISHEIKNPLAALRNDFTLISLKQKRKGAPDGYPLDRIDRNISRIDHTLTALTDYSRRQNINSELLDLSLWLENFRTESDFQSTYPDVQFTFAIDANINTRFDAESLHRAMRNLIDNALNAGAEEDKLQLRISLNERNRWAVLKIEDSGPGFGDADLDALCEPLNSGSATGLGLGLAIVNDIVKVHRGVLQLSHSTDLGGGAVTLRLPIKDI